MYQGRTATPLHLRARGKGVCHEPCLTAAGDGRKPAPTGPAACRRASAGRAPGTADAGGRGADHRGGRRRSGRGYLVRRGAGSGGHVAGRAALVGAGQLVRVGQFGGGQFGAGVRSPAGLASLAPAAALYPGAGAIEGVVNRYFQAINGRDYAAYQATQSPGIAMTESQFQAGFESTRDSAVLITGITTMPGGQPAADVTFTSQQQPQDGPDGESCTNWHVTMYFDGSAGTYTIGAPPNGYKASYQACSG